MLHLKFETEVLLNYLCDIYGKTHVLNYFTELVYWVIRRCGITINSNFANIFFIKF